MTSYNAVIVGQALNYEEVLDGTPLHSYLKILKNGLDDIIILNGGILNSYLRGVGTKFITIDYYTCNYLRNYASLQHKMYVESSVKREADIQKILPDVNNVFTISNNIETDPTNNKLYLELEKMRFGDKLEYLIEVAEDVDQEKELPNMLMQTWVENAIKHGIRHKEGTGKILVTISNKDSKVISVCVEDNGVGRAKAKELGTTGTGQGLKILSEQIAIYNLINSLKVTINTFDLVNQEGLPEGTRFEMNIPINYSFDF